VKNVEIIYARVPRELRSALEQERKRMSKAAGAKVKTSAVIRTILERGLRAAQQDVARTG
jgi:hypothetical protein